MTGPASVRHHPGRSGVRGGRRGPGPRLTVPGVGQTVILTRIAHRATPMPPGEDLASLGATGATLVLHLAVQRIEQVVAELAPH